MSAAFATMPSRFDKMQVHLDRHGLVAAMNSLSCVISNSVLKTGFEQRLPEQI